MKLFYSPGACSLSPHISLHEAGVPFDLVKVDTTTHTTETGADYYAVNPKGYVPALQIDSGDVLTEGAAVVQFIADRYPAAGLAPANGTLERARLQEHLNYIAAELHKAFSPLFHASAHVTAKAAAPANIARHLDHFERILSDGRAYLLGDHFSVADAYLFAVTRWTGPTGIGLDRWPYLKAFVARTAKRPAVQVAMKAEGLLAA
jgi:glutathione S-transferase